MREIVVSDNAFKKAFQGDRNLYRRDIEKDSRSCTPGEWVSLKNKKFNGHCVAIINNFNRNDLIGRVLYFDKDIAFPFGSALQYIEDKIRNSISYRKQFTTYQDGARLIYGDEDGLPGVIVDEYVDWVLIQINTAGMDIFRSQIGELISEILPNKKIHFFDRDRYRDIEGLPVFEGSELDSEISIKENGLTYQLTSKLMQKVGYYYDHRENRLRMKQLLQKINRPLTSGIDLFCYIGSWGLHLLDAGVKHVEFVDQANMETEVNKNLDLNKFAERGSFSRSDVFSYLAKSISEGKKFDVVVSDPPAFSKSESKRSMALKGYRKLHKSCLQVLEERGVFIAASCTHGVSHSDLDITVQDAAKGLGVNLKLVDIGLQGFDHRMSSLGSSSNYIKYLAYIRE